MSLLGWCQSAAVCSLQKIWTPFANQSRFRHYNYPQFTKEFMLRWGYYDRWERKGLLVHDDKLSRVTTLPQYKLKEAWTEKRALFGQNDYIDILGNGDVHPVNVLYGVPYWLRGFHGNELGVLIRKRKIYSKTYYPDCYPKKWSKLNSRIKYLYQFLNRKTPTPYIKRKA